MRYFRQIGIILIIGAQLSAGTFMLSTQESLGNTVTIKTYLTDTNMRVDTKGEEVDQMFVFRGDKEVLWVIDNKEQVYMEMTRKDLELLKEKVAQAMQMMEEQMKNIPPDQKKMLKEMMTENLVMEPSKITYKKAGTNEKVNQWICDRYEGYSGDKKTTEIWTTDWKKLNLDIKDFKVMQDMAEFLGQIAEDFASLYKIETNEKGATEKEATNRYIGIPIKMIHYSGPEVQSKTEVKEVKKQEIGSELFNLPEGFKKRELNFNVPKAEK